MKKFLLLLVVFLVVCSCEKKINIDDFVSEKYIQLRSINNAIITKDNGLLIAGVFDLKITFIKIDENFRTVWRKDNFEWGVNYSEGGWGGAFYSVQIIDIFQNEHDNFICVGAIAEGGDVVYSSTLVVELNQKGEEVRKIEFKEFGVGKAIKTSDNGYLFMGNKL